MITDDEDSDEAAIAEHKDNTVITKDKDKAVITCDKDKDNFATSSGKDRKDKAAPMPLIVKGDMYMTATLGVIGGEIGAQKMPDMCLNLIVASVDEFPEGNANSIYLRCGDGWVQIGSISADCPAYLAIVADIRETMSSWIDEENWTFLRINQFSPTKLAPNAPLKRYIDKIRWRNYPNMMHPDEVYHSTSTPCGAARALEDDGPATLAIEDGMDVDSD